MKIVCRCTSKSGKKRLKYMVTLSNSGLLCFPICLGNGMIGMNLVEEQEEHTASAAVFPVSLISLFVGGTLQIRRLNLI